MTNPEARPPMTELETKYRELMKELHRTTTRFVEATILEMKIGCEVQTAFAAEVSIEFWKRHNGEQGWTRDEYSALWHRMSEEYDTTRFDMRLEALTKKKDQLTARRDALLAELTELASMASPSTPEA